MEPHRLLPLLLGSAWLLPLGSFALIVLLRLRKKLAAYLAMAAIFTSCLLSLVALSVWVAYGKAPVCGDWYTLAQFGQSHLTIGYYIDALTVIMFAMVTFIASCIHVYSFGYMHEELHDVTDSLALLSNGQPLVRPGRFHRFYQYLSLFCFSMLGLVIAGNILMVFVFWELVGVCSYFLIGFYVERRSASNAANKAFIVNRVGDFGMLIGLMAVWAGLGTFTFGDLKNDKGIFSLVRPEKADHALIIPAGMVRLAARPEIARIVQSSPNIAAAEQQIQSHLHDWRAHGYGYGLLVIAGLGIFCGCVGKSAQFPLHVWLPDAMEGPTPVSALIHAATMVAAGVYLVGRFYPVFTPEVLLVIACVGCTTLFIAATIAITATDIKRVLAYSTVSQLGYMMLALGVGGWIAGLFHLLTHAFFKALLFLCSGSVIHATHTNEMPRMGGLWRKMPWTAGTMLVGCLAISGAGIPLVMGLSGYYSKDAIIAQLMSFREHNPALSVLFYVAVAGAAITTFYMFRLWFLTFAGQPRDEHVYHHAHESPRVMIVPLVILAILATGIGWNWVGLTGLLNQSRPLGTAEGMVEGLLMPHLSIPAEELSHHWHVSASLIAFALAALGFSLAWAFYGLRVINADNVCRRFAVVHRFLLNKWHFDELYQAALVRPTHFLARCVADLDRRGIDGVITGLAHGVRLVSICDDWIDRTFVDGLVNGSAKFIFAVGLWLRTWQTGNLRQYVMFMVLGVVALFVLISLYWNFTLSLARAG